MTTLRSRPTEAKPSVIEIAITPRLIYTPDTYDKIAYFVDQCKISECQWFSTIRRESINNGRASYLIEDIFIPHQAVDNANVETTDTEMMAMWKEIRNSRNLNNTDFDALLKSGLIWGHSHVEMAPTPSKIDDDKWAAIIAAADHRLIKGAGKEPVAMIIFNRSMKLTNRIYDPDLGIKWANAEVWVEDPIDYSYIDDAITSKFRKIASPTTTPAHTSPSYQNNSPNLYRQYGTNNDTPVRTPSSPSTDNLIATTPYSTVLPGQESTIIFKWDTKKKEPSLKT
jgi:hypothetical protein